MAKSSTARRKTVLDDSSSSSNELAHQEMFNFGNSDDEAGPSTRVKRSVNVGGGGIFSQVPATQGNDGEEDDVPYPPKAVKSSTGKAKKKRQSKITDLPAVTKSSSAKAGNSSEHATEVRSDDEDDEPPAKKVPTKSTKFAASKKKQTKITLSPAVKKTGSSAPPVSSHSVAVAGDSDDEVLPVRKGTPAKSNKFKTTQKKQSKLTDSRAMKKTSMPESAGPAEPSQPNESGSDSDDHSLFTPKKDRPAASKQPDDDDDDDSDVVLPSVKRRGTVKRAAPTDTEDSDASIRSATRNRPATKSKKRAASPTDDSDSEAVVRPTKRRRFVTANDNSTIASETEPKGNTPLKSSQAKTPSSSRRRRDDPKSEKKRTQELRRRRLAGEKTLTLQDIIEEEEEAEEGASGHERRGLYDTNSELEVLTEFEDDDEGVPGGSSPARDAGKKKTLKKSKARVVDSDEDEDSNADGNDGSNGSHSEDDEDDFVVEDDEGLIGAPGEQVEMPIEFSRYANAPLDHHFRVAIQWLVFSKIDPGFPGRLEDIYRMAWNKLDGFMQSLSSSGFISDSWKASDFPKALIARPRMVTIEKPISLFNEEKCMACNRGSHPSSYIATFDGPAYYKKKFDLNFLKEVDYDSDDEDDEDGPAEGERDEDNNRIPPTDKQYYLGRHCNQMAEAAHGLIHWKWNLSDWVDDALEAQGYMTADKIKERTKMRSSKRQDIVMEIMDALDKKNVRGGSKIKTLYSEFTKSKELAQALSTGKASSRRW